MQSPKSLKAYRKEIKLALDNTFLRETLDKFAVSYKENLPKALAEIDAKQVIQNVANAKDEVIKNIDEKFQEFKKNAEKQGVVVHLAKNAYEANEIINQIAKDNNCKRVIKSKSMTAEETFLNHYLEEQGLQVVETDLGEWIIQMRHEPPSHMVMPAIHLSRFQVADLFSTVTGEKEDPDIKQLVKIARKQLRKHFAEADMGITGANFAIAETGTIGICCNEGNARLSMTIPKVHVALCGLDKLTSTLDDALEIVKILPKNGTGQAITTYVNMVTGANNCSVTKDNNKIMHVVFLDNGRSSIAKDPLCGEALRCVRCGACANVCPIYRLVGGHEMGYIYIGAIGLILTYFYHGKEKAKQLVQNCLNCGACKDVCAAGIDLPAIISEIRARLIEENGSPIENTLLKMVMGNRKLFHSLLKVAKWAQKPVTGKSAYLRHLPQILVKDQNFRELPALAPKSFRDLWKSINKNNPTNYKTKVALFTGCAIDFIYPEQMVAAVNILQKKGVFVEFPEEQTCCGLPLQMMGERKTSEDVAIQNISAFDVPEYDYIITLCASCGSHIKHNYPRLLENKPTIDISAGQFVSRMIDFSSFIRDVLKLSDEDFLKSDEKISYHSPCHLCRGLEVTEQPRELIGYAANYIKTKEEDVCCGFGGSYSVKFPEISAANLNRKLKNYEEGGAKTVVTDCPGCVIQLRGGAVKGNANIEVKHIAEILEKQLK